jgi:hypothetical protein
MSPVMLTRTSTSGSSAMKLSAALATNGLAVLDPSAVIVPPPSPEPQPTAAPVRTTLSSQKRSVLMRTF